MKIQNILMGMAGETANSSAASCLQDSRGFSKVMKNAEEAGKNTAAYETSKKPLVDGVSSASANISAEEKDVEADVSKISDQSVNVQETAGEENSVSEKERGVVENKIKEILENDLQVAEEELNEAMEVLGLSLMDLLNPENLKMLAMKLKGASDITEVLMDDELSMMLTQVISDMAVENIAQESGVPAKDIEQLFQSMPEKEVLTEETVFVNEMPSAVQNTEENVQTQVQTQTQAETLNSGSTIMDEKENEESADSQAEADSSLPKVSVTKETSDTEGSLAGQKQEMAQGQNDLAENLVNNIVSSFETVSADGTVTMTTVEMRQVVVQIVQQIKVVINPEQTDMHMILHPEHLGRLQLAVTARDGVMTASFTVQNEMVKQALEMQMQDLRNAFTEQGLKVEAVEITVSMFEFAQSDQTGGNGQPSEQKKQRRDFQDMEEAFLDDSGFENAEERAAAAISGSGNNVDYTV